MEPGVVPTAMILATIPNDSCHSCAGGGPANTNKTAPNQEEDRADRWRQVGTLSSLTNISIVFPVTQGMKLQFIH